MGERLQGHRKTLDQSCACNHCEPPPSSLRLRVGAGITELTVTGKLCHSCSTLKPPLLGLLWNTFSVSMLLSAETSHRATRHSSADSSAICLACHHQPIHLVEQRISNLVSCFDQESDNVLRKLALSCGQAQPKWV